MNFLGRAATRIINEVSPRTHPVSEPLRDHLFAQGPRRPALAGAIA